MIQVFIYTNVFSSSLKMVFIVMRVVDTGLDMINIELLVMWSSLSSELVQECTVHYFIFIVRGVLVLPFLSPQSQKKTNGAPNGFYGEIDWDRYVSGNPNFKFHVGLI